jgi:electron transport complex protein RnfC
MRLLTFKGGIHPNDNKSATEKKLIVELPAPDKVVIPMQQHIGAICEPLVVVGDAVKKHQKIGDTKAFVSAPVHSSVSGTVVGIEPMLHPLGKKVVSVIIENDYKETLDDSIKPNSNWETLNRKEIIDIVREAGIVGMGGAGFPTHIKLSPPKDKKIEYIIINGAECEPYLTSDHRVMLENPEDIITGMKIIMKVMGLKESYIAIEANKADAIETMKSCAANEEGINVVVLKTKYPQGSEKHLIKAVTSREVPNGGLPMDVGVVVNNIDTCTAIARAVTQGLPLIKRIVTVAGAAVKNPQNYSVHIGTPFKALIEKSEGFNEDPVKIIMGGPMMGIAQFSLEVPVIKGTSGLLALTESEVSLEPEGPCIRCGRCIKVCPMNSLPAIASAYADMNDLDKAESYGVADCIECGSCCYVCPSKRHIVQSVRASKKEIIAKRNAQ